MSPRPTPAATPPAEPVESAPVPPVDEPAEPGAWAAPEPAAVPVHVAFSRVQRDLGAITKARRVQEGPARFAFRGVDDVMNALHGPLAHHGVVILPAEVLERVPELRSTRNGATMNVVHLHVRYRVFGPAGDSFTFEAWGEGQDSGDKATGKAHSMSYKSAMLQAFHVPTEDVMTLDADTDTTPAQASGQQPERPSAPPPEHVQRVLAAIGGLVQAERDELQAFAQRRQLPRPEGLDAEQAHDVLEYVASIVRDRTPLGETPPDEPA